MAHYMWHVGTARRLDLSLAVTNFVATSGRLIPIERYRNPPLEAHEVPKTPASSQLTKTYGCKPTADTK